MKKIFILVTFLSLAMLALAGEPGVKVITAFQKQYPTIKNVQWYSQDSAFIAYFSQNEITYNITYNNEGKLLSRIRYYKEQHLPFSIKAEVQEQFGGLSIYGVTELTFKGQTVYEIHLQDVQSMVTLLANQYGELTETGRYERRN